MTDKSKVLLCIDPGGTIGICIFDSEYRVVRQEQVVAANFSDYLIQVGHEYEVAHVVVEDYIIHGKKARAHTGSRVPAAQQIGKVELMAKVWGCGMTKQPSNILSIAQKWSGVSMAGDHSKTHWVSAYLHGYYYLKNKGLIQSKLQIEEEAKRKA